MFCCIAKCTQQRPPWNYIFSSAFPIHWCSSHIFRMTLYTGIAFLMAAGVPWSQEHMLFSLNCVASQTEEQKPSRTSGSAPALSPSFYPLSRYVFPEKKAMLLPAEPVQIQFQHLVLLETRTFTGLANHELTWHSTESWSLDQRHGELPTRVCYGQQCKADAKASSLCWSSREHFQRQDWPWTWKVCPRAANRHWVVGPWHTNHKGVLSAGCPPAGDICCSHGSSAPVQPPSDTATEWAGARNSVWYLGQPEYQPA